MGCIFTSICCILRQSPSYGSCVCCEPLVRVFEFLFFPLRAVFMIVWYALWLPFAWIYKAYELCLRHQRKVKSDDCILITGSSRGLGKHAALAFNAIGFTVFAGVRREEDGRDLKQSAVRRSHLIPVICDVTKPETIEATIAQIQEHLKQKGLNNGLTALYHNAGIFTHGRLETSSIEEAEKVMNVNYFGGMRMVQACLPLLKEGNPGRILFNSSIAGVFAFPTASHYCASKYAIEAAAEAIASEMAVYGIHVSCIQPGFTYSDLILGLLSRDEPESDDPRVQKFEKYWTKFKLVMGGYFSTGPNDVTDCTIEAVLSNMPKAQYMCSGGTRFGNLQTHFSVAFRNFMNTHVVPNAPLLPISDKIIDNLMKNVKADHFVPSQYAAIQILDDSSGGATIE